MYSPWNMRKKHLITGYSKCFVWLYCCFYLIGLNSEQLFYFNRDDVDKMVYKGYGDEEEERFAEIYQRWFDENATTIKKGITK